MQHIGLKTQKPMNNDDLSFSLTTSHVVFEISVLIISFYSYTCQEEHKRLKTTVDT